MFKTELNIELSDQRINFSQNLMALSNEELPRSEEVEKVVEQQLAVSKEKEKCPHCDKEFCKGSGLKRHITSQQKK